MTDIQGEPPTDRWPEDDGISPPAGEGIPVASYFAISLFIFQALTTGRIVCDHCGMPKQTRAEYLQKFEERRKKIKKMLAAELSYSEIARALDVSPEAIRRLVERMEAKQ